MVIRRLLVLAAAAGTGCSAPKQSAAPSSSPGRTIPFRAVENLERAAAGQSTDFVAGVIEIRERDARVLITERVIRGGSAERPETVLAGLAYGNLFSNDWRSRSKGRPVSLRGLSRNVADTLRDTLVLTLPLPNGVRLEEHWLYFEVWGTIRPPGAPDWVRGFESFHSRPDLFR